MIDESKVADVGALSPRAGVALMTLQLRSTLQEAIEAEAEVASVDVDAELWQLRSRLGPLMEERRQALADDLTAEQEQADASVVAARAEADQIVADARARADAAAEQAARIEAARLAAAALAARQAAVVTAVPLVTEPPMFETPAAEADVIEADVIEATPVAETSAAELPVAEVPKVRKPDLFDDPLLDWNPKLAPETLPPPSETSVSILPTIIEASSEAPDAPIVDAPVALLAPPTAASLFVPASDTAVDDSVWAADPPVSTSTMILPVTVTDSPADSTDPRAMHVVIDADSFAKAFAAALAPVLEARNQAPVYPPQAYLPAQAPPAKKSFWAHAWHPDVLLSGLAMVIVIIVLIAWTG